MIMKRDINELKKEHTLQEKIAAYDKMSEIVKSMMSILEQARIKHNKKNNENNRNI